MKGLRVEPFINPWSFSMLWTKLVERVGLAATQDSVLQKRREHRQGSWYVLNNGRVWVVVMNVANKLYYVRSGSGWDSSWRFGGPGLRQNGGAESVSLNYDDNGCTNLRHRNEGA